MLGQGIKKLRRPRRPPKYEIALSDKSYPGEERYKECDANRCFRNVDKYREAGASERVADQN